MDKILITGAAGGIGRRLTALLAGVYREVRQSDRVAPPDLRPGAPFVQADLTDINQIEAAAAGVEGIVHLGGQSVEAPWEVILAANIIGTYNLFEAARRVGVKRVVFASSNHVVGFYPRSRRFGSDVLLRPDSRYGVSKAFGEAAGALYACKYGLRVMCLRIGNVADRPVDARRLSIWIKPEDLVQLVRIGLEHPEVRYEVVYGVSDNARGWWDNSAAFRLGYRPSGRAEDHRDEALAAQAKLPPDPIGDILQGGSFCSEEFVGKRRDILP